MAGIENYGYGEEQTRREFLRRLKQLGSGLILFPGIAALLCPGPTEAASPAPLPNWVEARDWRKIPGSKDVRCELCPRQEVLGPGQIGICRIRQNLDGTLVTYAYNRPCVLNLDPIGKNPLNHFYPDMTVLAIAHAGCNLSCQYCQNWQFSQKSPLETRNIVPFNIKEVSGKVKEKQIAGISFTYTEAVATPEFTIDFAEFCGQIGLKRTLCTAGYVLKKPLQRMLRHFEAVTVTYKGATDDFYRKVIGGSLSAVQEALLTIKAEEKWLEVATLIVPTLNDAAEDVRAIAKWIKNNLGEDTPWHLERFNPQFKLTQLPPTSQTTLETARKIGLDTGLKFVYLSNISPHEGNHTYCPSCQRPVIRRLGFKVTENRVTNGRCSFCRNKIPGRWT